MTYLGAVLAFLGTIAVAIGGYWTAKAGAKASPYSALADRVVKLEGRVETLERDREHDRAYIRTLLTWVGVHYPGAVPPKPPDWYTH